MGERSFYTVNVIVRQTRGRVETTAKELEVKRTRNECRAEFVNEKKKGETAIFCYGKSFSLDKSLLMGDYTWQCQNFYKGGI